MAGTNPVAVQRPGAEARLAAAEGWPAAEVESEAGAEGVEVAVEVAVEGAVEVGVEMVVVEDQEVFLAVVTVGTDKMELMIMPALLEEQVVVHHMQHLVVVAEELLLLTEPVLYIGTEVREEPVLLRLHSKKKSPKELLHQSQL